MVLRIDAEPSPRETRLDWQHPKIERHFVTTLPDVSSDFDPSFFDVLQARKSRVGGPVANQQLATLLWHCTRLRCSGSGRFGLDWESRSAPSSGGLHPIRILCLPIGRTVQRGIYCPDKHELFYPNDDISISCKQNAIDVKELAGANDGVTLQLLADRTKIEACYENSESLLLRDAGVFASVVTLVATACKLRSVILGRMGTQYCRLAGISGAYVGVGAVHVSSDG